MGLPTRSARPGATSPRSRTYSKSRSPYSGLPARQQRLDHAPHARLAKLVGELVTASWSRVGEHDDDGPSDEGLANAEHLLGRCAHPHPFPTPSSGKTHGRRSGA